MEEVEKEVSLCKHGCCPSVKVFAAGVFIEDDRGGHIFLTSKEWAELKDLVKKEKI
jgi:hypothetical protein